MKINRFDFSDALRVPTVKKHWMVVLSGFFVSGCQIQTQVIKPKTHYDISLPLSIQHIADKYKNDFYENKLEDEEIIADESDNIRQTRLYHEYEEAINSLYLGNVLNQADFKKILDLIKYATNMFDAKELNQLLEDRSGALSDFVIDYQINAALNAPANRVDNSQVHKQVIAEQQALISRLKVTNSRLKSTEKKLRKEIKQLKSKPKKAEPVMVESDD